MKTKYTLFFLLVSSSLVAMGSGLPPVVSTTVNVTVVDNYNKPVEGAEIWLIYDNPWGSEREDIQNIKTDASGVVSSKGKGPMGIYLRIRKEGYHRYGFGSVMEDRFFRDPMPKTLDRHIVLKRIENPIPLYAKKSAGGTIPVENQWVGYDFERGDWVKPHGSGETVDILFRYDREFLGFRESRWTIEKLRRENRMKFERLNLHWDEDVFRHEAGKWDGVLEIAFPGEKEGLIKIEEGFVEQSILPVSHHAPEEGYLPAHRYQEGNYKPRTHRDNLAFFLRTRVLLDQHSDIKSANYAKLYGDFRFDPRGEVSFDYYFNPTPNDHNLEFNWSNLFPEDTPGIRAIMRP